MLDGDLPLFAWQPPCKLIAFPLINRVGKIRRCAEVLEGKTGKDADGYWRAQVRQLSEHLERIGCPVDEIERQVREFQDAVQSELIRRCYGRAGAGSHDPRGAA